MFKIFNWGTKNLQV